MRHQISRIARAILLCASVFLASSTAPAGARELPYALAAASAPGATSSATPAAPEDVNGTGRFETNMCIVCAAAVLGLGGATVAGLFFLAAALPEAIGGCTAICAIAFAL